MTQIINRIFFAVLIFLISTYCYANDNIIVKDEFVDNKSVVLSIQKNGKSYMLEYNYPQETVEYAFFCEDKIKIRDVNFDGFEDILIYLGSFGNKGISYYDCFLWDNKSQKFINDENGFCNIQNPKIDETGLCIYEIVNYSLRHGIFSVYTWSEDKLICSYKIHVITNSLSLNEVYRMEIPTDQDCAEYLLEYFGFDKNLDDICFYIKEDSSRNLSAPSEVLFNDLPDMLVSLIAYNIN